MAAASLTVITLHLSLWCLVLIPILLLRIVVPSLTPTTRRWCRWIYRAAVTGHTWWLRQVVGASWTVPTVTVDRTSTLIIISNHRSWSDALIIQDVICAAGPVVKFLAKRELARIPILALIFYTFDFPVLRRRTRDGEVDADRRDYDRDQVKKLTDALQEEPAAMLSFVEGTRFSDEKRMQTGSAYEELLVPRPGGLYMLVDALRDSDARLIDFTLHYQPPMSFWQFIGGVAGSCSVHIDEFPVRELPTDLGAWLSERWRAKDAVLSTD